MHTLFLVFECQESRVIKKNEPKRVLLSGGGGGGGGIVASTALSVFLFFFNKIKNILKKKKGEFNQSLSSFLNSDLLRVTDISFFLLSEFMHTMGSLKWWRFGLGCRDLGLYNEIFLRC